MNFDWKNKNFRFTFHLSATLIFWLVISSLGGVSQLHHSQQSVTSESPNTTKATSPTTAYTRNI